MGRARTTSMLITLGAKNNTAIDAIVTDSGVVFIVVRGAADYASSSISSSSSTLLRLRLRLRL